MRQRFPKLILGVAALLCGPASADPSDLCRDAAEVAAAETGVPVALIRAVMTAESGRTGPPGTTPHPWPWALNVDGTGYWPDSEAEALAMVDAFRRAGQDRIDIGCFQINLHWHGEHFASPAAMIDPAANAAYAAQFLLALRQDTGSWRAAAGAYHSRDPDRAEAYVQRLRSVHAAMVAGPAPDAPRTSAATAPVPVAFWLRRSSGPLIDRQAARGPLVAGLPGSIP